MASDSISCSSCGKLNPPDAAFCCYCGIPVLTLLPSPTTIHIQSQGLKPDIPDKFTQLISQSPDSIIIQILGHDKPIVAKGTSDIVLGRFSPGDPSPTVDLTPYHGSLMGVSRQHAIIKHDSTGYSIQDIGSTNGTWLNEEKLVPYKGYPLHSGDLIRLGQLGINIHFTTEALPQSTKITPVTLSLESEMGDSFNGGIILENLESKIIAYLRAVAEIQGVLNQLLVTDRPELRIQGVSVKSDNAIIEIKLTGVQKTVEFFKSKAAGDIAHNAQALKHLDAKVITGEQPALSPIGKNGIVEPPQKERGEAERALALELLESVAPQLTGDERKPYIDKLLPHVHAVTSLPLRIADR